MILGINDAVADIITTIKDSLGPIGHMDEMGTDLMLTTLTDVGIQLISTIILFIVIRFFFWKPITNILEKRREAIDKDLAEAEEAKKNAIELELKLKEELAEAKKAVKERLDKAEKEGNIKRDEIIEEAKAEAKRRMDALEAELESERKSMEDDIKREIVDIAFAAAEKIVEKEIDQDKYLSVVEYVIKEGASK